MNKVYSVLLGAYCCLASPALSSGNLSANKLHSICSDHDEVAQLVCTGYIRGAIEGLYWGAAIGIQRATASSNTTTKDTNTLINWQLGICAPEGVSFTQQFDIIKTYIANNPAQRHNGARTQVWKALLEAFPCK